MTNIHIPDHHRCCKERQLIMNGNFTDARIDLHNRGSKASFKLKKRFSELKPNVKTLLHMFDPAVKPIVLHGSEVL